MISVFGLTAERVGQRDRPEAVAVGTLRAITSAEMNYATMNGGRYDTLACLNSASCVGGIRQDTPVLVGDLASNRDLSGYDFVFHAGPPAAADPDRATSPSSMTQFAVVAIPVDRKLRMFCVDARQTIYVSAGAVPRVTDGRCVDTANPIR